MKRLLPIYLSCFLAHLTLAQTPAKKQVGIVYGKVIDVHNIPLSYVTISIKYNASTPIAAGISDEKGNYRLEGIPPDSVTLEFRLMGYQSITQRIRTSTTTNTFDAGTTHLLQDPRLLKEVTATAEQSTISLKLDKKVFEVGKDLLSQSGSVNDILNGVPSVSVAADGSVSLRGNSNVLVLINGRRTGLTQSNALDQIPSSMIEKVEVITNPSSRYDASGSAGIINLILKKNKRSGFNGQLKAVVGSPGETRVNPSLNFKSNKLNLFSTLGIRLSDYNGLYTSDQTTTDNNEQHYLNNVQKEKRHDDAKLIYLGADYQFNEHNSITAAYFKNTTHDHDHTALDYRYNNKMEQDTNIVRHGESWEHRNYNQVEFNYTRTFSNPRKKYTVDMQYDFWDSDKTWKLSTEQLYPVTTPLPDIRTSSAGASKDLEIQSDLVQPLNDKSTLELGVKLENRKVSSDFKAEEAQQDKWIVFDNINNKLQYNELIGSAYAQFNHKGTKFSYLLGLRTEITNINIKDREGTYNDHKNYGKIFPTLNLSYQLQEGLTTQFSYSKRINRPSLWMLYPFNELTDLNAQYIGNPALDPSYADVFELGLLRSWNKITFNPSVYFQHTSRFIQTYTYRSDDAIFYSTPVNIDLENRGGIELSLQSSPVKGLQLSGELNFFTFSQKGSYKEQDLNFSGNAVTGRIGLQATLPAKFSFQGRYNYAGPKNNAQSHTYSMQYVDFGVGKKLLKDKILLTMDATNIFNSRKEKVLTKGEHFVFNQMSNPNAARYRLTFVYKFNLTDGTAIRQQKSSNRN